MEDPGTVRIILKDPARLELWGRTVEVFRGYAVHLIHQGRARWETPPPIGFIWPDPEAEGGPTKPPGDCFPHRRDAGA